MKGRRVPYSSIELAWVEGNRTLPIGDLHEQFCRKFGRDDVTAANLHALRKRRGWKTGRTGRFAKGAVPANKGKKMPFNANSARTQFKPGNLPHTARYLGHERVSKDGYVEISIDETNPHTGFERRYVLKHRYAWEKANGPVPDGMCLKCLDGNKQNTDPTNWDLISRRLLPRLNGRFGRNYDDAPAELKPTIMAVAKLEDRVRSLNDKEAR